MDRANGLDGLLGKREPHATFHDARLVALSLDYRNNEAVTTWELCVGDPDDSMRAARERRRTGRLLLSGVLFWVIDPPKALDTRPGLPWLTECGPLSKHRRRSAGSWLASCPRERRDGTSSSRAGMRTCTAAPGG